MILFKQEHVGPILSGRKTQTRRLGKKRWRVGATHQCRTRMLDAKSCFALVKIRSVHQERLLDISHADARAEGYGSITEYLDAFQKINGSTYLGDLRVWVLKFEVTGSTKKTVASDAMSNSGRTPDEVSS